jgi:hypothetical protein
MALERLIRKETPESLAPARILALDLPHSIVQIQLRDTTIWAACDPSLASSLSVGDDVLAGRSGSTHYLVGKVPKTTPTQTTLLEV